MAEEEEGAADVGAVDAEVSQALTTEKLTAQFSVVFVLYKVAGCRKGYSSGYLTLIAGLFGLSKNFFGGKFLFNSKKQENNFNFFSSQAVAPLVAVLGAVAAPRGAEREVSRSTLARDRTRRSPSTKRE